MSDPLPFPIFGSQEHDNASTHLGFTAASPVPSIVTALTRCTNLNSVHNFIQKIFHLVSIVFFALRYSFVPLSQICAIPEAEK
jgi:hypothetical protein